MQLSGLDRPPTPSYSAPARIQETAYLSHEKLDISYQDASGQSFNLSIERDVAYYSATYDAGGRMDARADSLKRDLKEALHDVKGAAHGFRHLLQRFLKAANRDSASTIPGGGASGAPTPATAGVVAATKSVTVTMDHVDTDYWSVGKTAGRLADFAVSLYKGGDRQAHVGQMEKAMEEGYRQAAHAFGGALPDIARQTVDAARKLLADWAQGGQTADNPTAPTQPLDLAA